MSGKKIIAICQSGGEFVTEKDGLLSYKGGDAHAIEIDDKMKYTDLKVEVSEMFGCNIASISIKYFLPGNRKTLITISNNKDLERMIKFHLNSTSADIFVMTEVVAPNVSDMPASRSSRTTMSGAGVLVDAPLSVVDDVMDESSQPVLVPDSAFDLVHNITHVDSQIDTPTEVPLISFSGPSDDKHIKAAQQWQNVITGVGQRFNTVNEFRDALRKYAIAHQFAFKYKKNDCDRVTVKCKAESCLWRIHASRLSTTKIMCIKKMDYPHTCEGDVIAKGHPVTRGWLSNIIKEKLKVHPNYKPKDIINDINEEYGIKLSYFQAWRGKEVAREQLQGSYKEAYGQLPFFCEKIMETNPGSLATFGTKGDSTFHRLFVSFHASLYGFTQGCRSLIFLDSVKLKSKYQGTLLAATAADGDDGVFPVAFAIVDTESDDNWRWFLLELKSALSTCEGMTFVADREKGLKETIANLFQDEQVYHGYCLRFLSEQLVRYFKFSHELKRLIVEDLYAAAYAPKPEDFQVYAERIKSISPEAYNWVMQSEPNNWANAFFKGERYNHVTSNFGESFYNWATDAHDLPITQMVDMIRCKIMELFFTRRENSKEWVTRLTPSMEEKLEKESVKVRALQVFSSVNRFEVRGDSIEFVDIENRDCSCKRWKITGLPCCHALAIIGCLARDPYDYCAGYFTADKYRLTYSESINPIPNDDGNMQEFSEVAVTVIPPPTRRPPGRPAIKKIGTSEVAKRPLQCSRCKCAGHNKSTCKHYTMEG